jgi:UDP-glucose 4-epimerase
MKFLVTGGAGFIGSHLVEALIKKGDVLVLDDLSSGSIDRLDGFLEEGKVSFIQGSIADQALVHEVMDGVDYVFHLAALSNVPQSIEDPRLADKVNSGGTLNVLLSARDHDVRKVVYTSSAAVYGDSDTLPVIEDLKLKPMSPYAATKIMGEYYCSIFNDLYRLPTATIRPFNVYGPRQSPDSQYAAVIPIFISRMVSGRKVEIHGDGEQTRDFVYVKDLVDSLILASKSTATGIFNISGGGMGVSINDLYGFLADILRLETKPVYTAERPGDIKYSYADISRARKELGFRPKVGIREGLERTVTWFQSS